ncbi:MAG: hypothetical protein ACI33M_00495 [Lysinibacillus sp.]
MKRFTSILFLTFSRWGLITFIIYYAILSLITLNIFPVNLMYTIAEWVDPYYVTIRYVGIVLNIVICIMIFRFFMKYIQYESYVIRKKTLSFIVAASIIQLMSFFCYKNIPVSAINTTNQLINLQDFFIRYNFHIVEFIALFLTGYVLAFYIGTLARVKFLTDVVLAPKKSA